MRITGAKNQNKASKRAKQDEYMTLTATANNPHLIMQDVSVQQSSIQENVPGVQGSKMEIRCSLTARSKKKTARNSPRSFNLPNTFNNVNYDVTTDDNTDINYTDRDRENNNKERER